MRYFKPNTKKAKKLAIFIKGLAGTLGTTAYVSGNQNASFGVLILGAIANELVNLLSDATDENTPI